MAQSIKVIESLKILKICQLDEFSVESRIRSSHCELLCMRPIDDFSANADRWGQLGI